MANLAQACKVFLDKEFLSQAEQLVKLKQASAIAMLLGHNLQVYLEDLNNNNVRCGCPGCCGQVDGNYPRAALNFDGGVGIWKPSEGKAVATKDCKLLAEFKSWCVKFQAPLPGAMDTQVGDNECLASCLSPWKAHVVALPYTQQINRVYRMLHAIVNSYTHTCMQCCFEEWFTLDGVSLLP